MKCRSFGKIGWPADVTPRVSPVTGAAAAAMTGNWDALSLHHRPIRSAMTMTIGTGRRAAIQTLGLGIAASAIGLVMERTASARAAFPLALTPQDAGQLNALMQRLAKA